MKSFLRLAGYLPHGRGPDRQRRFEPAVIKKGILGRACPSGDEYSEVMAAMASMEHPFVFVCGLHKSGTSILFQCLREHPQISGFQHTGVPRDEGQLLQTVYPPALAYGGPGKFGFDPRAHLTEASPLVSDRNRERLFAEWARYWDLGRPVLLEKSPPNLIRTRFLQALFPNASFIVMKRHPIPVSYATQRWSKTSLGSLVEHWLICHETFAEDAPHLGRVLTVTYEDFSAQPQAILDRIYAFLGLNRHPNGLEVRSDENERYLHRWRQARRGRFSPQAIATRRLVGKFAARVHRLGYTFDD